MEVKHGIVRGDHTDRIDLSIKDSTEAGPMRRFLRPSRKKVIIAAVIPFLSLFVFLVLFGALPIGLRWCGGCMEENGHIVCYDSICIDVPYTICNILSHFIPGYVFVCYAAWAWNKIKGIGPERRRGVARAIYVLSLPLLLVLLPFVLLLLISITRPDYFYYQFYQFPLPPW
jgi:hypothetical protein